MTYEKLGIDPLTFVTGLISIGKTGYNLVTDLREKERLEKQSGYVPYLQEVADRYKVSTEQPVDQNLQNRLNTSQMTSYIAIGAAALIGLIAITR